MPTNDKPLPDDYELCGTCGYDHAYDVPFLSESERSEAFHAHLDQHPVPPYDLLVPAYRPSR